MMTPNWFDESELGAWEDAARTMSPIELGESLTDDYFRIHLSNVPRIEREAHLSKYWNLLGFDQDRLEGLGFDFVERRSPEDLRHGFGQYVLGREWYRNKSVEDIYSSLHYTMPNFQIGANLFPEEGRRLTGSTITKQYKRNVAEQWANPGEYLNKSRVVFDVETAGLQRNARIWQLAAQYTDETGVQRSMNVLFDNPYMDLGAYAHPETGEAISAMKYYQLKNGAKMGEMRGFLEGMDQFLDMVLDADMVVGQNVSFDIDMVVHGLEGAKGKMTTSQLKKYEQFLEKIRGGAVMDTQAMARLWFGGDITIDPAIKSLDRFTPYSMENILLQTNFLERLEAEIGTGAVTELLESGAHMADVDVALEDHLRRMLLEEKQAMDAGVKQAGLQAKQMNNDYWRSLVRGASAITPFTNITGPDGTKMTPIERLITQERKWQHTNQMLDPEQAARRAGLFSNWLKEERVIEETGRDAGRLSAKFRMNELGTQVQRQAIRAGLPFAGISNPERILTTMLSQISPAGAGAGRRAFGELAGTGLFEATRGVRRYGRNVALPMSLLLEAERQGVIGTQFGRAISGEALQMARISTVSGYNTGLALVADIFDQGGDVEKQLGGLRNFLEGIVSEDPNIIGPTRAEMMGLSAEDLRNLRDITPDLDADTLRYGVQIGYLDGSKDPGVKRIVRVMQQLNTHLDQPGEMSVVTPVTRAGEGTVSTGAALMDVGLAGNEDYILEQARAGAAADEAVAALDEDRALRWSARYAERLGLETGQIYKRLRPVFNQLTPRNALIGGAIAAGLTIFNKKREQDRYDESMEFQGYEDPPPNAELRTSPLQTAGMVQGLDRTKIGHHRMGADKYSHLY